jgi:tRNA threonylcarbamoyladenosine biosynthesis protein TsaB
MSDPEIKLVLGIDTSGTEGSLALACVSPDGALIVVVEQQLTGRHYSTELVPKLRDVLSQAGATVADLSVIVIVTGPGSFTGLRIGISAAKALAEAGTLPVIGVSRLAMLSSLSGDNTVAVLDAGRGEYYLRLPIPGEGEPTESLESLSTLVGKTGQAKVCICEPGIADKLAALDPQLLAPPTAADAVRLAWPRLVSRSFDDVANLDANYVRRPYADQSATATALP